MLGEPGKPGEPMDENEFKTTRFRVCCLNPYVNGALRMQDPWERLCGHGHGMTIEEMNQNLIWKGKPYIRIGYCKYCYSENTVGVLDDCPQFLGWVIFLPGENGSKKFTYEKLLKENYHKFLENWNKHKRR